MATNDPMATVKQYIDAFNKGDAEAMAATFAVPGSIFDGMAPHVWLGPTVSQQVTQTGALFTLALRKLTEGWRIAAWAWAKGTPA